MTAHPYSKLPISKVLDPILLNDPVLQQLHLLSELNVSHLIKITNYSLQRVNSLYKTELLIHISYLMNNAPNLKRKEIADLIGISTRNLGENIKLYQLPHNFVPSSTRVDINYLFNNTSQFSKIDHYYHYYKVDILQQLFSDRKSGHYFNVCYRLSGVTRDKGEPLIKQYQLKNKIKNLEIQKINSSKKQLSAKKQLISKANIPEINTNQRLVLSVHPTTRLFTKKGEIIRAGDLIKNSKLLEKQFLIFNKKFTTELGRISEVKEVKSSCFEIITSTGSKLKLGAFSRVLRDESSGILRAKPKLLQPEDGILSLRSFISNSIYSPSIFSLLQSPPGESQLEFIFKSKSHSGDNIAEKIKSQLTTIYGSIKQACSNLNLDYKHRILQNRYNHDALVKIQQVINYPDLHNPNFLVDVDTVRYAKQGGRRIEVDLLTLEDDLLYLMGLIASDGYGSNARKSVVGFSNKLFPLIKEFMRILLKYFPKLNTTLKQPKTKKSAEKTYKTSYDLATNNYAIRLLMINLKIKGSEDLFDENFAYEPIFYLSSELISAFIRGLFDGDGDVDIDHQHINIAVFHEERSRTVHILLKRLGINSIIKENIQSTTPPFAEKELESERTNIQISGKNDLLRFINLINPKHPERSKKLKRLRKKLQNQNTLSSRYHRAPEVCSSLFKTLRIQTGVSQTKVYNSSVGDFERGSRTSIRRVKMYVDNLVKLGANTKTKEYLQLMRLLKPTYNLDYVNQINDLGKHRMIKITVDNPLVTDIGIIVDGNLKS